MRDLSCDFHRTGDLLGIRIIHIYQQVPECVCRKLCSQTDKMSQFVSQRGIMWNKTAITSSPPSQCTQWNDDVSGRKLHNIESDRKKCPHRARQRPIVLCQNERLLLLKKMQIMHCREAWKHCFCKCFGAKTHQADDEFAYRIPPPYTTLVHQGKGTQDKHHKKLHRAMLLLLLPYKRPCHCWPTRVCCHTLTPDWLPSTLKNSKLILGFLSDFSVSSTQETPM